MSHAISGTYSHWKMTHCSSKIRMQLDVLCFYLLNLATFVESTSSYSLITHNVGEARNDPVDAGTQTSKSWGLSRKADCGWLRRHWPSLHPVALRFSLIPTSVHMDCFNQSWRIMTDFLNAKNTLEKNYIFTFFLKICNWASCLLKPLLIKLLSVSCHTTKCRLFVLKFLHMSKCDIVGL